MVVPLIRLLGGVPTQTEAIELNCSMRKERSHLIELQDALGVGEMLARTEESQPMRHH